MSTFRKASIWITSLVSFLGFGQASADWLMVSSNINSGHGPATTNLVVRKIAGEGIREELSPETSLLFLSAKEEQVILNHVEKTYLRQTSRGIAVPASVELKGPGEAVVFAGLPARIYRWTNGPANGCTWVGAVDPFMGGAQNLPVGNPAALNSNLGIGSLLSSNRLVVGTVFNGPVGPGAGALGAATNVSVTVQSTLVSIAPTNISPAEFTIPEGYREVTNFFAGQVKFSPELFGSRMRGKDNLEGLRKEYQRGRPLLQMPPGKRAN